ncbi:MAG TPA: alpha/beta fold hydrolase [Candidatus Paceibacterota bacterium]|jgi:dipeptidyl aminopeptidase/acylaminoacyl peptidase|nr:alpha/beta fold hydrolase [Candidatus Paceibacterota bacterium]
MDLKIVATVVGLLIFGIVGISSYAAYKLTHPSRETIDSTPEIVGLNFQDVSFQSEKDNTTLTGWWISAQNANGLTTPSNKTVIFVHGYGSSRLGKSAQVMPLALRLAHEGYNVLMFDLRGAGNSNGKVVTLGQNEQYDVLAAIDFIKIQKYSTSIALLGWSMGAVTSIMSGTESPDVQAIIADSPFADLRSYLNNNFRYWSGLPGYPFTPIMFAVASILFKLQPGKVSPIHSILNLDNRGLLLIHSCEDIIIPCQNSQQIYDAVPDKSHTELWLTEHSEHVKSYIEYSSLYEIKVLGFLDKYLK